MSDLALSRRRSVHAASPSIRAHSKAAAPRNPAGFTLDTRGGTFSVSVTRDPAQSVHAAREPAPRRIRIPPRQAALSTAPVGTIPVVA